MFRVTREIHFCYGHRLLNYDGKCRHLHGHNGKAVITIAAAKLDGLGMVMDFSKIKRVVANWIDSELDHRMLMHRDDPLVPLLRQHGEPIVTLEREPDSGEHRKIDLRFHAPPGFPGDRGFVMGNRKLLRDLWRNVRRRSPFRRDAVS